MPIVHFVGSVDNFLDIFSMEKDILVFQLIFQSIGGILMYNTTSVVLKLGPASALGWLIFPGDGFRGDFLPEFISISLWRCYILKDMGW